MKRHLRRERAHSKHSLDQMVHVHSSRERKHRERQIPGGPGEHGHTRFLSAGQFPYFTVRSILKASTLYRSPLAV